LPQLQLHTCQILSLQEQIKTELIRFIPISSVHNQEGSTMPPRKDIIIIGSGWAGSTLATSLDETKYSITVLSPETTTPYTPLLASAACGLYEFNLVETPIRHTNKKIKFVKAKVESIDFKAKTVKCVPAFEDLLVKDFTLNYDIVVIAPGVST
jgi:NADH:ubiquinone reductase (non-electrogenic)